MPRPAWPCSYAPRRRTASERSPPGRRLSSSGSRGSSGSTRSRPRPGRSRREACGTRASTRSPTSSRRSSIRSMPPSPRIPGSSSTWASASVRPRRRARRTPPRSRPAPSTTASRMLAEHLKALPTVGVPAARLRVRPARRPVRVARGLQGGLPAHRRQAARGRRRERRLRLALRGRILALDAIRPCSRSAPAPSPRARAAVPQEGDAQPIGAFYPGRRIRRLLRHLLLAGLLLPRPLAGAGARRAYEQRTREILERGQGDGPAAQDLRVDPRVRRRGLGGRERRSGSTTPSP